MKLKGLKGRHTNLCLICSSLNVIGVSALRAFKAHLRPSPVVITTGRGYVSPSGLNPFRAQGSKPEELAQPMPGAKAPVWVA
jgi:hypothetical protein